MKNTTLPLLFAAALVGILAVEGKLSTFWKAVITPNTVGTVGSTSVGGVVGGNRAFSNPDNGVVSQNPNSSGSYGDPTGILTSVIGTIPQNVGTQIANVIAQHQYAQQHVGVDPSFDSYIQNFIATTDSTILENRQLFINCYLAGGTANDCAAQYLPKG